MASRRFLSCMFICGEWWHLFGSINLEVIINIRKYIQFHKDFFTTLPFKAHRLVVKKPEVWPRNDSETVYRSCGVDNVGDVISYCASLSHPIMSQHDPERVHRNCSVYSSGDVTSYYASLAHPVLSHCHVASGFSFRTVHDQCRRKKTRSCWMVQWIQ